MVEALGAGGAERVISLLAARWAAAGWAVTICAFDRPGDPVYHALDPRVALMRLGEAPGRARLLSLGRRIGRLRGLLLRERPDAVLSFLTKINVLVLAAAIGTNIRIIVSERNNPDRQDAHPLWKWLTALLAARADAVVAQTRRAADRLPWLARRRAAIIPNPVVPPDQPRGQGDRHPLRIVAAGRLTRQKGFDLLISAFAAVAERHPLWSLTIWGEGEERAALARQADALGLTGRIGLPGVSAAQGGWTGEASAFVLSSRYEGFPNVLLEAMAAGLPVIAVDCPYGPREIIAHDRDGLLVPDHDGAALAEALDRLMGDAALRCRLGRQAALSVQRFRADLVARQWEALVDGLAGPVRQATDAPFPSGAMAR